ncbi:jacalin-like lectin domain-containing protein, partial [Tanacetum coccineum]
MPEQTSEAMPEQTSDEILKPNPNIMIGRKWSHQRLIDIKEISVSHETGWIYNISMLYDGPHGDIIREVGEVKPRHSHTHIAFAPDEFLTRIH